MISCFRGPASAPPKQQTPFECAVASGLNHRFVGFRCKLSGCDKSKGADFEIVSKLRSLAHVFKACTTLSLALPVLLDFIGKFMSADTSIKSRLCRLQKAHFGCKVFLLGLGPRALNIENRVDAAVSVSVELAPAQCCRNVCCALGDDQCLHWTLHHQRAFALGWPVKIWWCSMTKREKSGRRHQ